MGPYLMSTDEYKGMESILKRHEGEVVDTSQSKGEELIGQ